MEEKLIKLQEKVEKLQKEISDLHRESKEDSNDGIELNRWYKIDTGSLYYIHNNDGNHLEAYGFSHIYGWVYSQHLNRLFFSIRPATDEEVEEALVTEAKKRGFIDGGIFAQYPSTNPEYIYKGAKGTDPQYRYMSDINTFFLNGSAVFKDGEWAEVVDKKDEPLTVAGYEVKHKDHIYGWDDYKIGCLNFNNLELSALRSILYKVKDQDFKMTLEGKDIIKDMRRLFDKYDIR